ncbi:phage/plasmid primase, P4 family [Crocosphaera sp.]|uniref:phage/plasmid primase, P4 family n=1 Tax=Crocosphaera sp. TaxID=2729996 RepID=UPI0026337C2B|nr:phage/plasmid primase, P4 family [Crocosphaera sp.]MDJ0583199.1 phage/plasmid primase, P4 family [Crocosphaera sp.]
MNNIKEQHRHEWVIGSGVDAEIVGLNVRSLIGPDTYDLLLYSDNVPRRNDGRINNRTLKANAHLESGGYAVNAINPETGEDLLWGQLKPNQPKVTPDGKTRKYEVPPFEPVEAICLKVSRRIGLKVAKKSGLLKEYRERIREQWIMTEGITYKEFLRQKDKLFWKWVKENVEIAIAVVEGTKKAGALLSQGIAAISIPGIWNGSPKDSEGNPKLLPQLQYLATPGREIVIVFDQDEKLKTQANVIAARERLASCFREACCKVLFMSWETEEKGIDDAIVANGREWFTEVWENRSSEQASIKVSKLEHNLPKWSEEGLTLYFEEFYKDRLIFEDKTGEWHLYSAEKEGIWGQISKIQLERRIILELRELKQKFEEINGQIALAIKSVKESDRSKDEKREIIEQLKAQRPTYREITINFVEKLGKKLSRILLVKEMACNAHKGLIPFKNGVLHIETRDLCPHSPSNYFTWCLPYDYNPLATGEPIKQWLLEMMQGDESLVELIRAYLHGVVTGRADWQKFLELIGPGGTGKSTLIRLAIALVGFSNCHVTTLKRLETSKFETANIKDKRLVLVTDAERYTGDVTTLKALTGEDSLPYEKKMQQATGGFKPDCLVIIAGNEHIKTADYTSGLQRRRITVGMKHKISEEEQRNLIKHDNQGNISGEFVPYIPGFLNWVLEMDSIEASECIKNAHRRCVKLTLERIESMVENNPIAGWLNENIIYDPETYTHVGKAIKSTENEEVYVRASKWLYPNYCAFCEGIKVNPISLNRFSTLLLDLCNHQLNLSDVVKDRNRNGVFIQGLKIRDHLDDEAPFIEGLWVKRLTLSETQKSTDVTPEVMAVKPYVILETQSGEDCDGCVGTLKDFTKNGFNVDQPLNTYGESIKDNGTKNVVVDKPPKRSSQPSQSSPVRITETETCHDEPSQYKIIERGELMKRIDGEMETLGWTTSTGKEYLVSTYGVSSRKRLSDSQLLEFYNNLKAASSQPQGQTPNYEVGQFLQGLIPHPVTGTMKLVGKVIEVNGDRQLEDKQGVTYPLSVIEQVKVLSWSEYNG